MKKKSKAGLIIVLILLVAIIAIIAFVGMPILNELNEGYDNATALYEAGNYNDAYYAFLAIENYKDSAEKAAEVRQLMTENAETIAQKAQVVADMGFHMIAGMYLTQLLEESTNLHVDDYNELAVTIGNYYAAAEEAFAAVMAVDEKMPIIPMQAFMAQLEALEESNDPVEALDILSSVTSPPLAEQLIKDCIKRDTFVETSLLEISQAAPYWVPMIDQYFAAIEGIDIDELVHRQ